MFISLIISLQFFFPPVNYFHNSEVGIGKRMKQVTRQSASVLSPPSECK